MHAALCCPLTPGHGPALTSRWTNRQHSRGTCTRGKDGQQRLHSQGLPAHRADGPTALSTRKLFTSNCDVGHSGQATRTAGRRGSSPVPQAEAPEKWHLRNGWPVQGWRGPAGWGAGAAEGGRRLVTGAPGPRVTELQAGASCAGQADTRAWGGLGLPPGAAGAARALQAGAAFCQEPRG